jgi:hypothetical protein
MEYLINTFRTLLLRKTPLAPTSDGRLYLWLCTRGQIVLSTYIEVSVTNFVISLASFSIFNVENLIVRGYK